MLLRILVCLSCFLHASIALSFEPRSYEYEIGNVAAPQISIGTGTLVLEAPSGLHTIDSIRQPGLTWHRSRQEVFNQGYNDSDWWLKFDLVNTGYPQQFLIEIDYPVLDYVDVYLERDGKISDTFSMGDKLPFDVRPIQHRSFLVPFHIEQFESLSVYLRVSSTSSIQVPIIIWEPHAFQESEIASNVVQGIYIGGMLIIGIYNLLLFIALRDRSYLYYVGYVFSMLLFLSSLNGWTYEFLWPYATQWNDDAILFFLNGIVFFGIVFARHFLQLKQLGKSVDYQALAWIATSSVGFVAYFYLPYSVGIKFLVPYAAIACTWVLSTGIYAWHKGQRSASIYVLSWSGILVGGILLALNKTEFIPRNAFTDQSVQLGSLFEAVLLSLALAQRISDERAKRLTIKEKANRKLEASVAARTQELKAANQRLQELSDTDQLTQLKNRRYLDKHLEAELIRARRYQHILSVLIIDIDFFKAVNDDYGHQIGDFCLVEVAKRFSSQMRNPTDLCARYGGEEFCIMLPETDQKGALIVAERILKSISETNINVENFSRQITVSIGLYTRVPDRLVKASDYLKLADKALYKAKENGRNRVEVYLDPRDS